MFCGTTRFHTRTSSVYFHTLILLLFLPFFIYSSPAIVSSHYTNSSSTMLWRQHKTPSSIPTQPSKYCYQEDKIYTYYSGNVTISKAIHFQEGSILVRASIFQTKTGDSNFMAIVDPVNWTVSSVSFGYISSASATIDKNGFLYTIKTTTFYKFAQDFQYLSWSTYSEFLGDPQLVSKINFEPQIIQVDSNGDALVAIRIAFVEGRNNAPKECLYRVYQKDVAQSFALQSDLSYILYIKIAGDTGVPLWISGISYPPMESDVFSLNSVTTQTENYWITTFSFVLPLSLTFTSANKSTFTLQVSQPGNGVISAMDTNGSFFNSQVLSFGISGDSNSQTYTDKYGNFYILLEYLASGSKPKLIKLANNPFTMIWSYELDAYSRNVDVTFDYSNNAIVLAYVMNQKQTIVEARNADQMNQLIWQHILCDNIEAPQFATGSMHDHSFTIFSQLTNQISLSTGQTLNTVGPGKGSYVMQLFTQCDCSQPQCLLPMCFGKKLLDEDLCYGRGYCIDANQCDCLLNAYTGQFCEDIVCFGKSEHDETVCNGRGKCVAPDTCDCFSSFGNECDDYDCFGVAPHATGVCSGNGICVNQNLCSCKTEFSGSECQTSILPLTRACGKGNYLQKYDKLMPLLSANVPLTWFDQIDMCSVTGELLVAYQSHIYQLCTITWTSKLLYATKYDLKVFSQTPDGYLITVEGAELDYRVRLVQAVNASVAVENRISVMQKTVAFYDIKVSHSENLLYIAATALFDNYAGLIRITGCDDLIFSSREQGSFIIQLRISDLQCVWMTKSYNTNEKTYLHVNFDNTLLIKYDSNDGTKSSFIKYDQTLSPFRKPIWQIETPFRVLDYDTDKYGDIILLGREKGEEEHHKICNASFVSKRDSQGNEKWTTCFDSEIHVETVEVDTFNNIYVVGYRILDINSTNQNNASTVVYAAKLDTILGDFVWNYNMQYNQTNQFGKYIFTNQGRIHLIFLEQNPALKNNNTYWYQLLTDETCETCPLGSVSDRTDAVGISSCTTCPNGTYACPVDHVCKPCGVGSYSPASSTDCFRCPYGTYNDDFQAGACKVCPIMSFTFVDGATSVDCQVPIILLSLFFVTCVVSSIALCIFGCIIWCIVRKAKKSYGKTDFEKAILQDTTTNQPKLDINTSLFEISFNELKDLVEIGSGGSGTIVFKADWKKQTVAVKVFRVSYLNSENRFEEFEHELTLLSSLRHPNIIGFLGASLQVPRVGIVLEYCSQGNLKDLIKKQSHLLDWNMKIKLLLDIARGMEFLHSKDVIHRDLKLENVLIDKNYCAKISDFGVSKLIKDRSEQLTRLVGTDTYVSPEVTLGLRYDNKADVFSFAIVMFEVLIPCTNAYSVTLNPSSHSNSSNSNHSSYSSFSNNGKKKNLASKSTNKHTSTVVTVMNSLNPFKSPSLASDSAAESPFSPTKSNSNDGTSQLGHSNSGSGQKGNSNSSDDFKINIQLKVAQDPQFRPKIPQEWYQHELVGVSPSSAPKTLNSSINEAMEEEDEKLQLIPRESKRKYALDQFIELMQRCWSHDPSLRPSFEEIVFELEKLQE